MEDTGIGQNKVLKYKDLNGPKGVPFLGNVFDINGEELHQQIENWADVYGPVFKLKLATYKVIVVTDHTIIQQFFRNRPEGFIRQRKLAEVLKEAHAHGVFTAEGDEWKMQRRIVAKSLDVKHQQTYFNSIQTAINRLHNKWSHLAEEKKSFDLIDDLVRFTVDVTTSLALGLDMNTIEEKGGVIQNHMEKIFPMLYKRINEPFAWYKWIKTRKDREFDFAVKEILNQIDEIIEKGRVRVDQNPNLIEKPENFLDAILAAAEIEEDFNNREILGNLLTILMAGEDTTAYSLAWTIYYLIQDEIIQDKISNEANNVFPNELMLSNYSDHTKLTYTQAVFTEAMRLKPVAPLLLFEPLSDVTINGYLFEKGARILTQSRYDTLQPNNFSNPTDFDPNRWIHNKGKCPFHNTDSFTPFGGGPRICPGMNLAMLEMKLLLSMMCKNFKIELDGNIEEVREIMAFTMKPEKFKVKLSKREG